MNESDKKKIDWLFKNNKIWSNINNSFINTYGILNKQKKYFYKVERIHFSTLGFKNEPYSSYRNENTYVPFFSGNTILLETSNKITCEDLKISLNNLYTWLNKYVINIIDGKINICINNNSNLLQPEYSSKFQFINFDEANIIANICPSLDNLTSSLNNYYSKYCKYPIDKTYLYLKDIFCSNNIVLTEYVSLTNSLDNNVINKVNELKYKFNSSNSFAFGFSSLLQKSYLSSFKNFPENVYGSFLIYNTLLTKSFKSFPSLIEKDTYFINCAFNKYADLQNVKTHIIGNLILNNCIEEVYLLNALVNSQFTIDGFIFSKHFTGTLNELKEILK